MKKLVIGVLVTGLVFSLTACGGNDNSGSAQTGGSGSGGGNVSSQVDDPDNGPASGYGDAYSISAEEVIDDFKEAQRMLAMVDGAIEADYSDMILAELDGYDCQYYRVTEPGINTIEDLRELLYTRLASYYVDNAIDNAMTLREFDGVLYMSPAGRGDDLTISWVEYVVEINDDGESGTLSALIHRQDFSDETGEWYETGEVDTYCFDFEVVDGHAVFDSMMYF